MLYSGVEFLKSFGSVSQGVTLMYLESFSEREVLKPYDDLCSKV